VAVSVLGREGGREQDGFIVPGVDVGEQPFIVGLAQEVDVIGVMDGKNRGEAKVFWRGDFGPTGGF
jgi:hypothetical protein